MQTPAKLDYVRATSVADALEALQKYGDEARIVAGGHSLIPMMRLRLARPELLVDINDVEELKGIRVEGDEIVIGAMVRHREVLESAILFEHYPAFRECEKVIADPVVRNRGTVGGSFCQADPAEDLSALGSAIGGSVVIQGPSGTRTVPMREFHIGPYTTQVDDGEILTEVRIPIRPGSGSAYEKVERRTGDWAVAAVGTFVIVRDGVVADCGIGLSAVGAEHYCAPDAEAFLIGKAPTEENLATTAQMAADACNPASDQRGPADYKLHLAKELTLRALRRSVKSSGV